MPSNIDEQLIRIRESVRQRLNAATEQIVREEIEKVLGQVKILVCSDLKGKYEWFIAPDKASESK